MTGQAVATVLVAAAVVAVVVAWLALWGEEVVAAWDSLLGLSEPETGPSAASSARTGQVTDSGSLSSIDRMTVSASSRCRRASGEAMTPSKERD